MDKTGKDIFHDLYPVDLTPNPLSKGEGKESISGEYCYF
jgi:hypothetical protein